MKEKVNVCTQMKRISRNKKIEQERINKRNLRKYVKSKFTLSYNAMQHPGHWFDYVLCGHSQCMRLQLARPLLHTVVTAWREPAGFHSIPNPTMARTSGRKKKRVAPHFLQLIRDGMQLIPVLYITIHRALDNMRVFETFYRERCLLMKKYHRYSKGFI